MSWELVAREAAKTVAVGAGGMVVAGAGGVMRSLLRRLGAPPPDPEALRRAIVRAGERDPAFAAEIAAELPRWPRRWRVRRFSRHRGSSTAPRSDSGWPLPGCT